MLALGLLLASACIGSHREENAGENDVDGCMDAIDSIGGAPGCGMAVEDAIVACRRQLAGMDEGVVCCAPWTPGCTTDPYFCEEVLGTCDSQ